MLWSRRRLPIIAPSYKSSSWQSVVGSRQGCRVSCRGTEYQPLGAGDKHLLDRSHLDAGLTRSYSFQCRKISNIEQGISNRRSEKNTSTFEIPCSIFDIQQRTVDYPLLTTQFFLDFPRGNDIHNTVCLYRGILNGSH
jgi:hypothetical protein